MINLSIKFPEEMAQRLVAVFERALTVLEFHFPTPDSVTAWRMIANKAQEGSVVIPAKVSDHDDDYEDKLELAIERIQAREGFDGLTDELIEEELADLEDEWDDVVNSQEY